MKKIIIGSLVGTMIYFAYQTIMWMGGLHGDIYKCAPNQEAIMNVLNQNLTEDGLYWLPSTDPANKLIKEAEEKLWKDQQGKPWVMIFYHKSFDGMEATYMLMGILYSLIGCLIVSLVLFYGNFATFNSRFIISMAFSLFALSQGVLDNMNWWSYPWSFVKPEIIDLTFGWAICSVWMAWYFKQ